jgi:hypothetical protein
MDGYIYWILSQSTATHKYALVPQVLSSVQRLQTWNSYLDCGNDNTHVYKVISAYLEQINEPLYFRTHIEYARHISSLLRCSSPQIA